ncbi:ABC transporter permease [Niveispirillum sp.]|uniref:ABC transporter permease n=1 Tax=Niveispirillum sp. TaxID=1917217 RepID=UPI001B44AD3E|nr:ABC transporter permease [Niveispirillum sp.]MBP7338470.1 ABC transporter permease [Niveispirillum sp.]
MSLIAEFPPNFVHADRIDDHDPPPAWLVALVKRARGLLLPVLLAGLWHWASTIDASTAYAFVPLDQIGDRLLLLLSSGELAVNAGSSLGRALTGLALGGLSGIVLGSLMAGFPMVERLFGPLLQAFRQVPLLGWLPLVGLWLGSGEGAKQLLVAVAAFHPLLLNSYEGFAQAEKKHLEVGRVLMLSRWRTFRFILLPTALPSILTGIGQALAFAWISTIGVELLFGTGAGLGSLMHTAQMAGDMGVVVLCVVAIGLMGYGLNLILSLVRARLLRWRVTG